MQCVRARAGAVYDVSADLFIPEQETVGRAGVSVFFYEKSSDCNAGMGGTDLSFTTKLVDKQEEWAKVGGRFVVPAGVNSMQVRLIAAKAIAPRAFLALFDNVLVQAK